MVDEVLFRFQANVDLDDDWHSVVFLLLRWAKNTLTAIHFLIGQGALHEAQVLLRHQFELAVVLRYLEKCPHERSDFVSHYFPPQAGRKDLELPKTWRAVYTMCKALCLPEEFYQKMYRYLSIIAHGGVSTLRQENRRLLGYEEVPDYEVANILFSAMLFYNWALAVGQRVVPYRGTRGFASKDWGQRMEALEASIYEAYEAQLRDLKERQASDNAQASP